MTGFYCPMISITASCASISTIEEVASRAAVAHVEVAVAAAQMVIAGPALDNIAITITAKQTAGLSRTALARVVTSVGVDGFIVAWATLNQIGASLAIDKVTVGPSVKGVVPVAASRAPTPTGCWRIFA